MRNTCRQLAPGAELWPNFGRSSAPVVASKGLGPQEGSHPGVWGDRVRIGARSRNSPSKHDPRRRRYCVGWPGRSGSGCVKRAWAERSALFRAHRAKVGWLGVPLRHSSHMASRTTFSSLHPRDDTQDAPADPPRSFKIFSSASAISFAAVDQPRLSLAQIWLMLAKCWPHSANTDRHRPTLAQMSAKMANFWPHSANTGQTRANFGRARRSLGRRVARNSSATFG